MPPRLADRLREHAVAVTTGEGTLISHLCADLLDAAAALDRTEALEQAAQAWAKLERAVDVIYDKSVDERTKEDGLTFRAHEAAVAALLALSGGDPQ